MRRGKLSMKCFSIALFILILAVPIASYGLDQPHDPSQSPAIDCGNCHWLSGAGTPAWSAAGPGVDDTVNNKRCRQCHDTILPAVTHSTTSTSSTLWATMGGWQTECIDCHNPHYQRQNRQWGAASYITTGTISSITPGSPTSTITLSGPIGAEYQNYYFIPNTALKMISYKIKSLTNGQSTVTVQGTVDTTLAASGDTYAIVYAKNIKDSIAYTNPGGGAVGSATVKMFRPSGTRAPGDSAFPTESVCYVCHTLVNRAWATVVAEHAQPSPNCVSCHSHDQGFKGGGCDTCHGNPPIVNTVGGPSGLAWPTTGSLTAGKHVKHATSGSGNLGYACGYCHTVQDMNNVKIDLGFNFFGYTSIGSYDGRVAPGGKYQAAPGTTVTQTGTLNCNNIYCHSTVQGANGVGVGTWRTARWLDTAPALTCSGCHNDMAGATGTGSHVKHANNAAGNYNIACSSCHTGYSFSTVNPALHVNNTIEVAMGTGSYSGGTTNGNHAPGGGYGNCSTNNCHSDGQATPVSFSTPVWGSSGSAACGTCHGVLAGTPPASAKHLKHVGSAALYRYDCAACHSNVVTATTDSTTQPAGWVSIGLHVNNVRDVKFDNWNTTGSYTGGTCATIYCHSSGTALNAPYGAPWTTATWTGAAMTCNACHGDGSNADGRPGYSNGAPKANAHQLATHKSLGCDKCHYTTSNTGTTITSVGNHVNKAYDVVGTGTAPYVFNYSYAASGGTCATSSCHGTNPIAWNTTGSLTCASCHEASNLLALRHDKHYGSATVWTSLTQSTDAHTATNYVYACAQCHPTASHATGPWNSMADAQVGGAKMTWYTVGAGWTTDSKGFKYSVTGTCGTVCHTKDGSTAGSQIQAFNWATVTTGGGTCGICHNKQNDATPTWSTAHTKHVNSYAANANLTCNACHSGTASSMTTINGAAGRNLHPNAAKDVAFNGWASGAGAAWSGTQCSNTYCHSNGTSANAGTHAAIAWNTTFGCTACHATTALSSGVHAVHVNDTGNQVGFSITCDECHSQTAANNTTITTVAYHVDKNVNIRFNDGTRNKNADQPTYNGSNAWTTIAGGASKAVGTAAANCANVYCHSVGNLNNAGALVAVTGGAMWKTINWSTVAGSLGCDGCHGGSGKAHPWYTTGLAGSTTANSHVKHVESSSFGCDYCHNTTVTGSWVTPGAWSTVGATHLNRAEDVSFKLNGGQTGTWNSTAKTCSATYCHGTSASLAWGSTTNCASCHAATNTGLSTRHDKHYNLASAPTQLAGASNAHTADTYAYACLQCHPTGSHSTGPWNSFSDAQIGGAWLTSYTQGAGWTTDSTGFKYSVTASCATACHTRDGVGGAPIAAPSWGTTFAAGLGNCGYCHNKQNDGSPTWTPAHSRHINGVYAANTNINCAACHAGTALSMTTINGISGRNQHPNGNRDLAPNAFTGGAWVTVTGAQGSQTCANTYCHSNGTSTTGSHVAQVWNTTITNCSSCHAAAPATGAHTKHLAFTTLNSAPVNCNSCHAATATGLTTISGYAYHVDKNVTVQMNNSFSTVGSTYNGQPASWNTLYQKGVATATGTCNTTFCHGGNSGNWGTASTVAQCVKCHGVPWTTSGAYTANNNTAAPGYWQTGVNTAGSTGTFTNGVSNDSKVGAHDKHLRAYTVWGTIGYTNNIVCDDCHTVYVSPQETGHMNGVTNFSFSSLARNAGTSFTTITGVLSPSYSGGTCSAVYCHGNAFWSSNRGNGISPGWTSNAYITTVAQAADTAACNRCHLSPPVSNHAGTGAHPGIALAPNACNSCHTHTGWGTSHINGTLEASGGTCNACHWFDTTDAGAWATVEPAPTASLWNSTNAWGAHIKHINHLKAKWGSTLSVSGTFGDSNYKMVCGVCHTSDSTNDHDMSGSGFSRQIWATSSGWTTAQFGSSLPSWNTLSASRSCSNVDCHYKATPAW